MTQKLIKNISLSACGYYVKDLKIMKNEVLFVLLNDYADYEPAYISGSINCDKFGKKANPKYVTKVVAPTMDLVRSCGGFNTMPDYSFDNMPEDYAALILIGGFSWMTDEAKRVAPIVKDAISKGIIVGGICNGASFLAQNGFLNNVKHTGNGPDELKRWGGDNYTNPAGYENVQTVSDQGVVTANGTASLEFAVELMKVLEIDTEENIAAYYQFMHLGFCDFMKTLA